MLTLFMAKNNNSNVKKIVYKYDLPESVVENFKGNMIAIDTETMGLDNKRDRLCLIQILIDDTVHMVHFPKNDYKAKNLKKLLSNPKIEKIFHFARFDLNMIYISLNLELKNVVCTKTLSKIVRTYSDKHGLKILCSELLNVDINKHEQSSYWGKEDLYDSQINYAANDVIYLPEIFKILKNMAEREKRYDIAEKVFKILLEIIAIENRGFNPTSLIDF